MEYLADTGVWDEGTSVEPRWTLSFISWTRFTAIKCPDSELAHVTFTMRNVAFVTMQYFV